MQGTKLKKNLSPQILEARLNRAVYTPKVPPWSSYHIIFTSICKMLLWQYDHWIHLIYINVLTISQFIFRSTYFQDSLFKKPQNWYHHTALFSPLDVRCFYYKNVIEYLVIQYKYIKSNSNIYKNELQNGCVT